MILWKLLVISTGSTIELLKIRGSFGMNESSSDNAQFNFALNENHSTEDGWKLYLRKSENVNGKNWWVLLIQRYDFHGGSSGKLRIKIQVLLFHSKDKNICYIGKSYAQTLWVKMLLRLKAVFNVSLTNAVELTLYLNSIGLLCLRRPYLKTRGEARIWDSYANPRRSRVFWWGYVNTEKILYCFYKIVRENDSINEEKCCFFTSWSKYTRKALIFPTSQSKFASDNT